MEYIFTSLCFLPFIGFNIGTDTQPYAFLAALLLFAARYRFDDEVHIPSILAVIILMCLSVASLVAVLPFQVIKRLFSYFSVLIIPAAVRRMRPDFFEKSFERVAKLLILLWFLVGFVQTVWDRSFMSAFVPLMRTSSSRGVCGLASEPSFYGYMCFFFFLFTLDFKNSRLGFMALCLIQTVLFARSAVSIVYFLLLAVMYSFSLLGSMKLSDIMTVVAIFLAILFVAYVVLVYLPETRMAVLLRRFLSAIGDAGVIDDESVQQRINAIILSLSRYGVPYYIGTRQIMSGFGGMIYEMGIFSLLIILPILTSIRDAYPGKMGVVIAATISICMLSAIQLSSPLFGYYIGYCWHRSKPSLPERDAEILLGSQCATTHCRFAGNKTHGCRAAANCPTMINAGN